MRIIISIILLCVVINIYANTLAELKESLINNNIKQTIDMLHSLKENEKKDAINILIELKNKIAFGRFTYILSAIKNDDTFFSYLALIDEEDMDERIYPFLLNYFENKEKKQLINFIIKYDNCNINYYKYAKAFYIKGIINDIIKRVKRKSQLDFNINVINYAHTSDMKSLKRILLYENYKIKEIITKGIFNDNQIKILLKKMNKKRINDFLDIIVDFAIKDIKNDYEVYFKYSKYKYTYSIFRKVIDENFIPDTVNFNNDIINNKLNLAILLFSGQFELFEKNLEYVEKSNLYMYFKILYALFNSNIDEFNELISVFIISEKSYSTRMEIMKLQIITDYIQDGTFFMYYIKGDIQNANLIARIMPDAKPLLIEMNNMECEYADMIEKNAFYIIINDIINNNIKKKQLNEFMKKYPESMLRSLLLYYEDY